MKQRTLSLTFAFLACQGAVQADIVIPGANGSDGALNITADTVIDLSQAPTGTWDQDNSANAGKGVYDPEKWAVVFKYTGINIAAGAKVTFKNNASRAPVVWLVSGDVTIAGTVDLSGENTGPTNSLTASLTEPGPGGFRGGAQRGQGNVLQSAGFGPGGGKNGGWHGSPGGYGSAGSPYGPYGTILSPGGKAYGNPSMIPLIGGSGGSASPNFAGGAGGGAILIATRSKTTISGAVLALGGNNRSNGFNGDENGAGSGGGVRIITNNLLGNGSVSAAGGWAAGGSNGAGLAPGSGRVRIERVVNESTLSVIPSPSVVDIPNQYSAKLWPENADPSAQIVSVNSVAAPADPKAAFGSYSPDVALPLVSQVEVIVETVNVESASQVFVRITPRNGMTVAGNQKTDATEIAAVVDQEVSTNPLKLRWKATLPTLMGHSALQARVIRP